MVRPGENASHLFTLWGEGESRAANSDRGLVLGVGGLGKPNRGRDRGETFFPDSGSDRDSDETFQISRNLGLELDEFVCLLDSQPWLQPPRLPSLSHNTEIDPPVLDPWSVEWDKVGATFCILLASCHSGGKTVMVPS